MLIRVAKPKLVLGRSIYVRGDVFPCPDQEAAMMEAIGIGFVVKDKDAVATREAPLPPKGMDLKGAPPSLVPTRAKAVRKE